MISVILICKDGPLSNAKQGDSQGYFN